MKLLSCTVVLLSLFLYSCGNESANSAGKEPETPQDYAAGRRAYDSRDYATAYKIWLPLAKQGDKGAQFWIGFLSESGLGVKQDKTEAVKWYLLSSDQNMGDAQARLCRLLSAGQGAPQDDIQAYKWAEIASELGNADAQKVRDQLKEVMKPAEIKEATRLVDDWKAKHSNPSAQ